MKYRKTIAEVVSLIFLSIIIIFLSIIIIMLAYEKSVQRDVLKSICVEQNIKQACEAL